MNNAIGENIKRLRKANKYTQKDLAKLLNIPRNKLSDEYHNNDLGKYNIVISSYNKYVEQNGNTL